MLAGMGGCGHHHFEKSQWVLLEHWTINSYHYEAVKECVECGALRHTSQHFPYEKIHPLLLRASPFHAEYMKNYVEVSE